MEEIIERDDIKNINIVKKNKYLLRIDYNTKRTITANLILISNYNGFSENALNVLKSIKKTYNSNLKFIKNGNYRFDVILITNSKHPSYIKLMDNVYNDLKKHDSLFLISQNMFIQSTIFNLT
jgi:hypothetical protein